MKKIRDLPLATRLSQLAEECAELTKAALKMVRAMNGDTPVTVVEARENLTEEIADVNVCMAALQDVAPLSEILEKMTEKANRWEDREDEKADARRKLMEAGYGEE